ncbi:uncharacterized protein LOC100573502 [Acyrthosiphon pisum]|uniref:C2H2-type domain-containing protein n=1 Tax=Acyrthosiphon pisum TaxID=7029 RepID=A0A8R2H594_ACYPI|nr:uncharacterized protein LOC100573502 [Acyrthosiphon pisum]|eukprot:XP_016656168.1 PREDICTED: uncharacterized protein LOC100573502 isoform X1 [Acyrthosiphon pisum]
MEEFGSSNMEELKCMVCNKYFSYKRTLKRHLITCGSKESKNLNSVKCPDLYCNNSFTNKKMLKLHIQWQTIVWSYKMNKKHLQLFMISKNGNQNWKITIYVFMRYKTVGQNKKHCVSVLS